MTDRRSLITGLIADRADIVRDLTQLKEWRDQYGQAIKIIREVFSTIGLAGSLLEDYDKMNKQYDWAQSRIDSLLEDIFRAEDFIRDKLTVDNCRTPSYAIWSILRGSKYVEGGSEVRIRHTIIELLREKGIIMNGSSFEGIRIKDS